MRSRALPILLAVTLFADCGGKVGTDDTSAPPVAQGGYFPSGGTGWAPTGGGFVIAVATRHKGLPLLLDRAV